MKKIIKTKLNENGIVERIKFEGNSSFTDIDVAINMTEKGQVEDVHVVKLPNGKKYLRSNPDNQKKNNLKEISE